MYGASCVCLFCGDCRNNGKTAVAGSHLINESETQNFKLIN
jgi:hypothetical protein